MRRLAASVCVLSLCDEQGQRYAMTATSVTSVSDAPPSLLICINKETAMAAVLQPGHTFCVNILSQDQEAISILCAGLSAETDRFSLGKWHNDVVSKQPYLEGAEASFFCRSDQIIDYGSHLIVIGQLQAVLASDNDEVRPLLYADGGYRQLAKPL